VRRTGALALVAALAGCGGGDGEPLPAPPPAPRHSPPETVLSVVVEPTGTGGPSHETRLECDPAGGNHPAPEPACAALAASPHSLDPVPDNVACTQQYGGPERASVRGVRDGRQVDATFSRANGCEIARWDALQPLFRVPGG
jgi:Subtilisin inhibitor-like